MIDKVIDPGAVTAGDPLKRGLILRSYHDRFRFPTSRELQKHFRRDFFSSTQLYYQFSA